MVAWLLWSASAAGAVDSATTHPRRYSNADFYVGGVFRKEVAKDAIAALLEAHGDHLTPAMREKLWISDFGMGDFEHLGLSSITWVNRQDEGYYAMTMYLLPGQMLPEHRHLPIAEPPVRPAKHESWRVLHGWAYNFSSVGPASVSLPATPKRFGPIQSTHMDIHRAGEVLSLRRLESWHFMMAGPQGAIVDEYGNFQDRRGWRSSNPAVHIGS
ncbi:MAG: D-lyxose ketol-isomerase [Luteibacter sp.]|nr:MAG: D-lyxose ketol-isomerase [Luteibacter sp.]